MSRTRALALAVWVGVAIVAVFVAGVDGPVAGALLGGTGLLSIVSEAAWRKIQAARGRHTTPDESSFGPSPRPPLRMRSGDRDSVLATLLGARIRNELRPMSADCVNKQDPSGKALSQEKCFAVCLRVRCVSSALCSPCIFMRSRQPHRVQHPPAELWSRGAGYRCRRSAGCIARCKNTSLGQPEHPNRPKKPLVQPEPNKNSGYQPTA